MPRSSPVLDKVAFGVEFVVDMNIEAVVTREVGELGAKNDRAENSEQYEEALHLEKDETLSHVQEGDVE